MNAPELIVTKKGKKGLKEVDIKPLIIEASLEGDAPSIVLKAKVFAGSSQNLNPELLVKALLEGLCDEYEVQVSRQEMYTVRDEELIPLSAFGCLQ